MRFCYIQLDLIMPLHQTGGETKGCQLALKGVYKKNSIVVPDAHSIPILSNIACYSIVGLNKPILRGTVYSMTI